MDSVDIKARAIGQLGATQFGVSPDLTVTYYEGNAIEPSDSDIADRIALIEVQQNRRKSYPSKRDFMEAYTEKEIGGDSTKWDAYVVAYNKVRTDNPKP
jgi:hypothetical protein